MPSRSIRLPTELPLFRRWSILAVVLGGLVLSAGIASGPRAYAAPPESDSTKRAREHYKRGDEAFKANRFDEAFAEFEAGFNLSNRPLFLLNMAHAERKRGDMRKARAQYKRYLLMEPESKLRGEVEAVVAELDAAIAADEAIAAKPAPAGGTAPPSVAAPMVPLTPKRAPVPPLPPPAPAPPVAASPPAAHPYEVPPPPDLGPPPLPPTTNGAVTATASTSFGSRPPADERSRPFWQRWELWAGAGAVVVAAVVLGVALSGPSYEKDGTLGTIGP